MAYDTVRFNFEWICSIIILSVFNANISNAQTCGGLLMPGFTTPAGDINIEYGNPLEIYCTLNTSDTTNGVYTSKNLSFYRRNELVQSEMIEIVNSTTIRLYVEKPPISKSMYFCKLNNSRVVCLNQVAVGTKPQNVTDFSCVGYNYDNLTCTWTAPLNYIKTTYTLIYGFPGRNNRQSYRCPRIEVPPNNYGLMKCYWDITTSPPYRQTQQTYYFWLNITNIFGNITNKSTFAHFERVIPNPPERLIVLNRTSESIFLNWTISNSLVNFPTGLDPKIVYQSEYDHDNEWIVANVSKYTKKNNFFSYNLTDLKYAHALYDIRVKLKSKKAREESMWSNFSSITVRTSCKLPEEPPKTNIGSFETVIMKDTRDIFVYWQSIPDWKKNCEDFRYEVINIEENGVQVNLKPIEETNAYAKFRNMTFNRYKFSISSVNKMGQSIKKSVIHVPEYNSSSPKSISKPKQFTKIAHERGLYELSWSPADDKANLDSYTIFWCNNVRDRPYQCKGLLNWTEVSSDITTFNITVLDNEVYQVAISANHLNQSSGMIWASCTVIYNRDIIVMKTIEIENIGASHISVKWNLDCSDRIASIKGFYIYYCPIKSPYSNSCKDAEKSMFIDGGDVTKGTLEGLKPYTTYRVSVSLVTMTNSTSLPSEPLFKTTLESAPDTPPMDIKVMSVTSNSIFLKWSPPKIVNGYLQQYQIFTNASHIIAYVVEGDVNNITMTNLESYKEYNISIVACTVACSLRSEPITVYTKMSNPEKMIEPSIKQINETQISVVWLPPNNVRGRLDHYELRVKEIKNSVNYTIVLNTTDREKMIPDCQDDIIYYCFSVRAVNVDPEEKNQVYKGMWSNESQHYCRSHSSFIYLLIAFFIGFLFISILIFSAKKIWQRYLIMRDVEVKLPPGLVNPTNDISMTQRSGPGIPKSQNNDPKLRPETSADEEHLLTKKECIENQDQISNGDSSGCSSGHESVTSSIASTGNYSISTSDSGTKEQSPSESSLRQRKTGSETLGWDKEIAWPNAKSGYVSMPSDKTSSASWPTEKVIDYCVLGVDSSPSIDQTHGYVPVPVTTHMDTGPKKSSYVTRDAIFNKNDSPKSLISPAYVKTSDTTVKKGDPVQSPKSIVAPYVMAGNEALKLKVLSNKLIDVGGINECHKSQPLNISLLSQPGNATKSDCSSGYVKTDDILNLKSDAQNIFQNPENLDTEEPLPGSYCRLGWDSSKPNLLPANLSLDVAKDSTVSLYVPSASSNYLTHSAVQNKPVEKKSYVPHRPFEVKSLKED